MRRRRRCEEGCARAAHDGWAERDDDDRGAREALWLERRRHLQCGAEAERAGHPAGVQVVDRSERGAVRLL